MKKMILTTMALCLAVSGVEYMYFQSRVSVLEEARARDLEYYNEKLKLTEQEIQAASGLLSSQDAYIALLASRNTLNTRDALRKASIEFAHKADSLIIKARQ